MILYALGCARATVLQDKAVQGRVLHGRHADAHRPDSFNSISMGYEGI